MKKDKGRLWQQRDAPQQQKEIKNVVKGGGKKIAGEEWPTKGLSSFLQKRLRSTKKYRVPRNGGRRGQKDKQKEAQQRRNTR